MHVSTVFPLDISVYHCCSLPCQPALCSPKSLSFANHGQLTHTTELHFTTSLKYMGCAVWDHLWVREGGLPVNIKSHFSDETAETLLISANCGGVGCSTRGAAGIAGSLQPTGREIRDKTLCPPRILKPPSCPKHRTDWGCTAAGGSASPSPSRRERSSPGNRDRRGPSEPRDGAGTPIPASWAAAEFQPFPALAEDAAPSTSSKSEEVCD